MKCDYKNCVNQAPAGKRYCMYHKEHETPAAPALAPPVDEDVQIISLADLPAPRANEVAMALLKSLKVLGEGKALKVRLRKFGKPSLLTTQRYALLDGLRIGVRFTSEWAFLWRMTAEQVKAAEVKAERLKKAREKKKPR